MPVSMPKWMHPHPRGVAVDPDLIYPSLFKEIERVVKPSDIPYGIQMDQYWLEVVYQCMKLEVQRIMATRPDDPRKRGIPLEIHVMTGGGRKGRWNLAQFPPNRGISMATKGLEARHIYKVLRGGIPN
jgi:hypothetical protein